MTRELRSHPNTLLKTHLQTVLEEATAAAPRDVQTTITYAAAFHDLGKATTYFQEYIRGERDSNFKTHHSNISALATYYAAIKNNESKQTALTAAHAVYAHHKHLSDTNLTGIDNAFQATAIDTPTASEYTKLKIKADDLPEKADKINSIYNSLLPNINFDVTDFCEWITSKKYTTVNDTIINHVKNNTDTDGNSDSEHVCIGDSLTAVPEITITYAALRIGDIKAVTGYETPARNTVSEHAITQYTNELENNTEETKFSDIQHNKQPEKPSLTGDETLNELRGAARREALYTLHETPNGTDFYDIQLPTGLGKTLTGLETAATIRTQKCEADSVVPRIIYAMPQTTIIDQNHDTLTDAFAYTDSSELTPREALKHHHASTETHTVSDAEYGDYAYEQYLTRRWDAELITTTFVQLFESLITPRKEQTHRFESLQNAVIVLDEVQALPSKYWDVIRDMLPVFADVLDWTVITMTATDPQIVSDSTSLIESDSGYFDRVNRVTYTYDDSITTNSDSLTPEETAEYVTDTVFAGRNPDGNNVNSVLCIMNTISQAKTLHDAVTECIDGTSKCDSSDVSVIYLSSNLPHSIREKRLNEVTQNTDSDKQIIVSTQVTETGVDMTTDVVIREIAPVDSLIQAGGRCNRNAMTTTGRVHVIKTESTYDPETLLYGKPAIKSTRTLLTKHGDKVPDNVMTTSVLESYYETVTAATETGSNMDALKKWSFDVGSLQLIEATETLRVVVTRDEDDKEVLEEFKEAVKNENWGEAEELQSELQEIIVSMTVHYPDDETTRIKHELPSVLPDDVDNMFHIDSNGVGEDWYDEETGVMIPESTAGGRLI